MNTVLLFWKLLRYRVAMMLPLFMLLAVAIHGNLDQHPWKLLVAVVTLGFSYVSATSSNDIADERIDKLNHRGSPGRPLITGVAVRKDMWRIFGLAGFMAILGGLFINVWAFRIMLVSLAINVFYSLPPVRLSYRIFLAPLALGLAYVCVPYLLGLAIIGSALSRLDVLWMLGLYLLFVGRIILKDFRDREGDAAYNKPTFLLRFGKSATCAVSFFGLMGGGGIILFQTRHTLWLLAFVAVYLASIALMLRRLLGAAEGKPEQLSIGVGAKMGNGLLITLLAVFALQGAKAPEAQQLVVSLTITGLFFANYLLFWRDPQSATIAYKG